MDDSFFPSLLKIKEREGEILVPSFQKKQKAGDHLSDYIKPERFSFSK